MEPIVSFVTTYALLVKSQFLLAAAWVQSQALLAATSFASATLGIQLAIASAAILTVIFVSFSAYKLYKHSAKKAEAKPQKEETLDDPIEFCSPIGDLELMKDPVIASDLQTYERADIEKFFKDGQNDLSPITGEVFANHNLIPNNALKAKIDGYVALKNAKAPIADIQRYLDDLNKPPKTDDEPVPPGGAPVKKADINVDPGKYKIIQPPPYVSEGSEAEESEADDLPPPPFDDDLFSSKPKPKK